jgi:hypothetical protein
MRFAKCHDGGGHALSRNTTSFIAAAGAGQTV